ncbi:MAG: hypothetical protein GOP50_02470 [Candidatus Heimdallarchaeota archaeon]|nr:hypothetical protein [Candidatus Heimdallarchaeota archaeon]
MKKWLKIFLIIFIPVMLGILSFGGTILYSYLQIDYSIGETTVAFDITPDFVEGYVGFVELTTPAEIQNKGLYSIRDLTITISVYGANFSNVALDGELLASGVNELGDVVKGQVWDDDIIVEITNLIVLLAIYDGDFDIQIAISLNVDFGFLIPINIQIAVAVPWDAPFTF